MRSHRTAAAFAVLLGLAVAPAAFAESPPPPATEAGAAYLALALAPPKDGAMLTVSTPAFKDGTDIPFENTSYRDNRFPGLSWSKGPAATKSYAVIMQDTDAVFKGDAILHWTMYNVPPSVTELKPGMTEPPAGASFGPNIRGPSHAYMGPRTPPGPKHRYHLQVFALDTTIPADPNMTWDALKGAIVGHVLASGQVVGLGQADPTAPPPPPKPPAQ